MYAATTDPACYAGSIVLKNIPGLTTQGALDRFEAAATGRRFMEPLPGGRLSLSHYQAVHRHIFQDVYKWAGRFRTVRISKGSSAFCYPENIPSELNRVFGHLKGQACFRNLDAAGFAAGTAHFLAELNAIHPFRDGNGRSPSRVSSPGRGPGRSPFGSRSSRSVCISQRDDCKLPR